MEGESRVQDEREWELTDEDLDRVPARSCLLSFRGWELTDEDLDRTPEAAMSGCLREPSRQ